MSGIVVVDAGLAVKWVLPASERPRAIELLTRWEREGVRRAVPSWFAMDVAGALYHLVAGHAVRVEDATEAVRAVLAAVSVRRETPALAARAIEIAARLDRPDLHGAPYLALSEQLGCELWTADERFYAAAKAQFPQVRGLGAAP